MKIPTRSEELIRLLSDIYPDRMDTENTKSEFDRGKEAGKVELIRTLLISLEQQLQLKDK